MLEAIYPNTTLLFTSSQQDVLPGHGLQKHLVVKLRFGPVVIVRDDFSV